MDKSKTKYNFHTGKEIKKIKKVKYKLKGKRMVGDLKSEIIDGKRFYYIQYDFGRSIFSANKNNFIKVEHIEEEINWRTSLVEKTKPKDRIIFDTKIDIPRDRFLGAIRIKLGKDDGIHFFETQRSNIIKDLQLKEGDKLKITIEVQKR